MKLPVPSDHSPSHSEIRKIRIKSIFQFASLFLFGSLTVGSVQGAVSLERWNLINGGRVNHLLRSRNYPVAPDLVEIIATLATPSSGDRYGQRLRAVLTVPESGYRVFRIAGDDQSQLFLTGDTGPYLNKTLIASVPGWTRPGQWNRYPTQTSPPVYLEAESGRYLEVLHKEGWGGDHVSVEWASHDFETGQTGEFSLIPGNLLTAYSEETGYATLPAHGVLVSRWYGIGRSDFRDLRKHPRFPYAPHEFIVLDTLSAPRAGDFYGQRLQALLTPAESAYRVFRIAGDDYCKLSLSNGPSKFDGRARMAWINGWTQPSQWNRYRSQTSVPVYLEGVTGHYLEVLHKEGRGQDHVTVQWALHNLGTGQTGEFSLIPTEFLKPYAGEASDLDRDDLPDDWEQLHGFDPQAPGQDGKYSRDADPDSDLISNKKEALLGTDPFAFNRQVGHFVHDSWHQIYHYAIEDLRKSNAFYGKPTERTTTTVDQVKNYPSYSGHRLRAHFTPISSGPHRFWLSARTSAQLWISEDGTPFRKRLHAQLSPNLGTGHGVHYRTNNLWDVFASQRSGEIELEAGRSYFVEIIVQHGHGGYPHVSLAWAPPRGKREPVPVELFSTIAPRADDLDDDSLPDHWESTYGLSTMDNGFADRTREGEFGDFDLDGLLNRKEYMLGTDPSSADTDGDGLSDGDEVHAYRTDPKLSDAISETLVSDLDLNLVRNLGKGNEWNLTSRGLVPSAFRGEFALDFEIGQAGFHILEIQTSLVGELSLHKPLEAEVFVDGRFLGRYGLTYTSCSNRSIRAVTSYLPAGRHELRLRIRNMFLSQSFSVSSISVLRPEGGDLDGDGQSDWIVNLLTKDNRISVVPQNSRISPAFLEGTARDSGFVTFNGGDVLPGRDHAHWYANLPLETNATGATPYEVGFEQSLAQIGSITWARTDPFELNGTTLRVRLGDSLILTGEADGTLELPDGQIQAFAQAGERIFTFDQVGEQLIRATRPGQEATLNVEVLQAVFSKTPLDLVHNKSLDLRFPLSQVSSSLYFESGPGVRFDNPGRTGGPYLHLTAHPNECGPARLLGRLYAEGPVAGAQPLNVLAITDATQNGPNSTTRADGLSSHYVMDNPIVVSHFPEGGRIELNIFRAGVTFLDGTKNKTLRSEDFVNGINTVSFLIPNGMRGGFCHRLRVFDRNGRLIANR
jgi:hypothetical protein